MEDNKINLVKKIFAFLGLVGIAAYVSAKNPSVLSYYGGWSNASVPATKFTAILPAFAELKQNGNTYWTDYSRSGNFEKWSDQPGAYKNINDWAKQYANYADDTGKLYVSYGGGGNTEFRGMVINANDYQLNAIAGEIKANVKNYWFTGVDLDIEGWWDYNRDQNKTFAVKLAKLVKILRSALDADPQTKGARILVSVGMTSASSTGYPSYNGTMLPFYQDKDAMNSIQYVNIMAYNTGAPNFYSNYTAIDQIIQSFKDAVGPENINKLSFGIQPRESKEFPVTQPNIIQALASHLKTIMIENMFMWAIGAEEMGGQQPLPYIQAMKNGLGFQD